MKTMFVLFEPHTNNSDRYVLQYDYRILSTDKEYTQSSEGIFFKWVISLRANQLTKNISSQEKRTSNPDFER